MRTGTWFYIIFLWTILLALVIAACFGKVDGPILFGCFIVFILSFVAPGITPPAWSVAFMYIGYLLVSVVVIFTEIFANDVVPTNVIDCFIFYIIGSFIAYALGLVLWNMIEKQYPRFISIVF